MIKQAITRTRLVILIVVVSLIGYMFAYNPARPITIRIGFYADSPWNVPYASPYRVIDQAIDRFETMYPNVSVVYESGMSKAQYNSWLSEKIAMGAQPDVFMVPDDEFNLLSSIGALEDLTAKISADHISTDMFFECAYASGTHYDHQYALPYECNPTLMCMNRDLLESLSIDMPKPDWTTNDFYQICQKVTKLSKKHYGSTGYTWQHLINAYGIHLFDDNGGNCYFNTAATKKALSLSSKLHNLYGNYQVTSNDFDSGRVAFAPMTLAEYRTYLPYPYRVAKYSTFKWSCIELPSANEDSVIPVESTLFGLSSKSAHKELAWAFLKLLTMDEAIQQELMTVSSGTSVLKSVVQSEATQKIIDMDEMSDEALSTETLMAIMNRGTTTPQFKSYTKAMAYADYLITASINKDTIEMDLADIQREMENYIK